MTTSNATILVVDDEPYNLEIIEEYLFDENYTLFTASDGEEAMAKLEAEPDKYDLILLDRMMPKMDGMEVLERVKKHPQLKSIPVILQTAKASPKNIIEGMNSGAFYYLIKPFDNEMLCSIVKTAIEDKMRYDALRSELEDSVKGLATLHSAEFEYRTIDEANNLAKVLANTCAKPKKAVIGISELLINAVEHGNLKIGYNEKSTLVAHGEWQDEIVKRLELDEFKDKKVKVSFVKEGELNKIVIEDQGNGFEWQNYIEFDPHRAFDSHGRGIAMTKLMSVEKIDFQGSGNIVEILVQSDIPIN